MKYNLIYFDANQLEDYFFNQTYQNAYDQILSGSMGLLWTGRVEDDKFICIEIVYNETRLIEVNKSDINKIWIRGKNFDYEKYKDFNVINTKIVEEIADDKNKTYEYLKDLMPESTLIKVTSDEIEWTDEPNENYPKILKPTTGLKGQGILKFSSEGKIDKYLRKAKVNNYILQEFIECTNYEPLGIKGTHDIRLIIVNSEIVGLSVRQPKEGGWLCNVAQGGSIKVYDLEDLNTILSRNQFLNLCGLRTQVISKLPQDFKQAIFSIDFCNTKDGFKIFELNSYPGIRLEYKTYINKVKEILNG